MATQSAKKKMHASAGRTVRGMVALLLFSGVACSGSRGTAHRSRGEGAASAVQPAPAQGESEYRAWVKPSGELTVLRAGRELARITPELHDESWRRGKLVASPLEAASGRTARALLTAEDGTVVESVLEWTQSARGPRFEYTLTPQKSVRLKSLHIALNLPMAQVAGQPVSLDAERLVVPLKPAEPMRLASHRAKHVSLALGAGRSLGLEFREPTDVLVQDNRRWEPELHLRLGTQRGPLWPGGAAQRVAFELSADDKLDVQVDVPVEIGGPDWVPLQPALDVEPGSALDFSGLRPTGPRTGSRGRVVARPNGSFAFERNSEEPVRFYGTNLCFGAQYLSHGQADILAERLLRLGYNAVRIHHHDGELVSELRGEDLIALGAPPSSVSELRKFEGPSSAGDHYTSRIRGFLVPDVTAKYTFHIASDDESVLFLGSDERAQSKREIARVPAHTARREWHKYASQTSLPVELTAKKRYYIEALHGEGTGGDHLAVAWSRPGSSTSVIEGRNLAPWGRGRRGSIVREVWPNRFPSDSVTLNPARLDELDYLLAAFGQRGIYVATDLYVSRPVFAHEIWPDEKGVLSPDEFKMAVLVNERAFDNWRAFALNLLAHKNPHTGMRWADDPTLAFLGMINEGNAGNFLGSLRGRIREEWQRRWNQWLLRTYGTRETVSAAWGSDPGGDPKKLTVPLDVDLKEDTLKASDAVVFLAEVEGEVFERMQRFLRHEVRTRALLSNQNGWTNRLANQAARLSYDFVDDHFYVDHPEFLGEPWKLPSRFRNASPVAEGTMAASASTFVRLLDKPFVVSEYNHAAPSAFRGAGGLLTGALAATQGFGAVFRFAYSHSREHLFVPAPIHYFDLARDPLNQASERAAIALFLRKDLPEASRTVAIVATVPELLEARRHNYPASPGYAGLELLARVGTFVGARPEQAPADLLLPLHSGSVAQSSSAPNALAIHPYSGGAEDAIFAAMQERGWLPTRDRASSVQVPEIPLRFDRQRDVLTVETPMTAGGFGPSGASIQTASLSIHIVYSDATIWVSSIDGQPISRSRRLLVSHLTDVQNSGSRFEGAARNVLLDWGKLPYLVRDGRAELTLRSEHWQALRAWALALNGRRTEKIALAHEQAGIRMPLDVKASYGARMLYEIAVE